MVEEIANVEFKLTADTKRKLNLLTAEIFRAKKAMDSLKSMGVGTEELEAKLDWADNVRKTLLKEFS
jgi:hypothetical protein